MKCWGATSKICAVLMITIPLLIYSLSTTTISDSTINISVPAGTDVTNLIASFSLSINAVVKINQTIQVTDSSSNDYTNPVIFTIHVFEK